MRNREYFPYQSMSNDLAVVDMAPKLKIQIFLPEPYIPMTIDLFLTRLGWAVSVGDEATLYQLSLGHKTRHEALRSVRPEYLENASYGEWYPTLTQQVQAYTEGDTVDFRSVRVDFSHLTDFGRRVVKACRTVSYGRTCTYAELAEKAGSPLAARAVGSQMAANRTILVVPCHRIVARNHLGGFSAPGGLTFKRKLIELERRTV